MKKQSNIVFWWMLAALLASRFISMYSFYLYDDAFITFRFSKNLAEGHGFVYNIGEYIQGISTPLWGLLLSIPGYLNLPLEIASKLLNLFFDVLSLGLLMLLFKRESALRAGLFTAFLFAIDLYLAKTSVSGMEAPLFLFLTLASTYFALNGRLSVSAAIAAASVFVRYEGALFCIALLSFTWIEQKRFPLKAILLGSGIILIGSVCQYLYYDSWIPQSLIGKANLKWTLHNFWGLALFPVRDPLQFVLTLTTIAGLPFAWRESRFVRLYSSWAALLIIIWIVTGAHLWSWYCYPVWFWKALVTGVALDILLEKYFPNTRIVELLRPSVLSVICIMSWIVLAIVFGPSPLTKNVYEPIASWSRSKSSQGQSSYGMDFGAFGYYSGLRIIDEPGLVWPDAITEYNCELRRILLGENPEYAFVTNYLDNVKVMHSNEIAKLYEPMWRVSMRGDTTLPIPLTEVSQVWIPDFTLYKRR